MFVYKKAEDITEEFSVKMNRYRVAALLGLEDTKKQRALLTGKLITLFDRPNVMCSDIDGLYTYYISTELDGKGIMIVPVIISFGSEGLLISAPDGFVEKGALFDLAMKIRSTVPGSYEIKCRNERISADIVMGVKNGIAYYETVYNKTR